MNHLVEVVLVIGLWYLQDSVRSFQVFLYAPSPIGV